MRPCTRVAIASIALSGLLSACTTMSPGTDPPDLDGTAWGLTALPGRALLPERSATLHFATGPAATAQ